MKHHSILTGLIAVTTLMYTADGVGTGSGGVATAKQVDLAHTDFCFLIDKSGSMSTPMPASSPYAGLSRWEAMIERMTGFITDCCAVDKNGVDVGFYDDGGKITIYENVTVEGFNNLLNTGSLDGTGTTPIVPSNGTLLAQPLQQMIDLCASRYDEKNQMIFVYTDGKPTDTKRVKETIAAQAAIAHQKRDEQLSIGFIQVGEDATAKEFLTFLDDGIANATTHDIVNTMNIDAMRGLTLQAVCDLTQND